MASVHEFRPRRVVARRESQDPNRARPNLQIACVEMFDAIAQHQLARLERIKAQRVRGRGLR